VFLVPAGADPPTNPDKVSLSYDFSDNNNPASASNGVFNIIVNVLPEQTPGVVRIVAVAPAGAGVNNLVCRFQVVSESNVECGFNFTASGTWAIHAQYAPRLSLDVAATAGTNISVSN
jgi:hypothetical protein